MVTQFPNIVFDNRHGATDIEIIRLQELFARIAEAPSHNPRKPHRLTFFALLIVTEGRGRHQIDLLNYEVIAGSVLKIAKGQVHSFQEDITYDGYLIIFTEEFVLKYFSKSSLNYISHLYNYHTSKPLVNDPLHYHQFLDQIFFEWKQTNTYAQKEILAKILELYLLRLERKIYGARPVIGNSRHQELFLRFKNLVEVKFTATRNVKDYAEWLRISPKHLNEIVRSVTLNTAKTFIDEHVVLEAKRSMISDGHSLKEVAFKLGFDEVTNFSKFFKKRTGLTPKAFKSSFH